MKIELSTRRRAAVRGFINYLKKNMKSVRRPTMNREPDNLSSYGKSQKAERKVLVMKNILIVDDDEGVREVITTLFKCNGYHTTVAKDGYEAITKVKTTSFDVILMDIKMPGMNGVETFFKIKRIHPQAVVILMTAYSEEELIKEALREGVFDVIYKPFSVDKMIRVVEKALKKSPFFVKPLPPFSPDTSRREAWSTESRARSTAPGARAIHAPCSELLGPCTPISGGFCSTNRSQAALVA